MFNLLFTGKIVSPWKSARITSWGFENKFKYLLRISSPSKGHFLPFKMTSDLIMFTQGEQMLSRSNQSYLQKAVTHKLRHFQKLPLWRGHLRGNVASAWDETFQSAAIPRESPHFCQPRRFRTHPTMEFQNSPSLSKSNLTWFWSQQTIKWGAGMSRKKKRGDSM